MVKRTRTGSSQGSRKAVATRRTPGERRRKASAPTAITLSIDIGGSGIKGGLLDGGGRMTTERLRLETPRSCPPERMVDIVHELAGRLGDFDRVSVGFPGVVRDGVIGTAVNLGGAIWHGFDLAGVLRDRLARPVRVLNDADMQGLGAILGEGFEMVITLGTGIGTSLFHHGRLLPHMEVAHHPFRGGKSYEEYIGDAARRKTGNRKWNRRVRACLATLRRVILFDRLHLGGGNARKLDFPLDPDTRIVSNETGILGGIALWRQPD